MAMAKNKITAKAPSLGVVQVNEEWKKVSPETMDTLEVGDFLDLVPTPLPVESKKEYPVKKETDWAAKDRSQLVGGRSHDAVELVKVSLANATPMNKVLEIYKEALLGVLKIADDVK